MTTEKDVMDRRSGLTRREFVEEYQRSNHLVIFTDLTKDWPARHTCTLGDYIDPQERSTIDPPAPYSYKLDMRADFKDLVDDVQPRPAVMMPDHTHSALIARRFVGGLADLKIFLGGL